MECKRGAGLCGTMVCMDGGGVARKSRKTARVRSGPCCKCKERPRAKNSGYCAVCRLAYHRERRWQKDRELVALRARVVELEAEVALLRAPKDLPQAF